MLTIPFSFWKAAGISSNPPNPSFYFTEDFEGTGYENSWSEVGVGTMNEDYTTDVLRGSQSFQLVASAADVRAFAGLTSKSTVYGCLQIKINSVSGAPTLFSLRNTGTLLLSVLYSDTTGKLRLVMGAITAETTDSFPIGSKVWIWFRYTAGTGSNAIGNLAFSTDGIKPTSGGKVASITNGVQTANVNRIYCGHTSNITLNAIYDRIVLAESEIWDNP